MASIQFVNKGIQERLEKMSKRTESMQGFLDRNVYRMYQNFQRTRWMTENDEVGNGRWHALNNKYAMYKKKKFASYEGNGTKMLIATGKLFKAVIGPGNGQRKVVTNKSLYISVNVPYAGYVNDVRSIGDWNTETMRKMKKAISNYAFFAINI